MKRLVFAGGLALALIFGAAAPGRTAGWVDDWITQKSEVSPGYFEGQKRGYFNGGGFSARWALRNDALVNATPPRLKAGCGGIDAFMGGFSFLDTQYLVTKLQRIMSAAPAAAFDIALKTLAPQVSDTIRSLESMADKLNSIQLDECKASRAMVATIATTVTPGQKQGELGAIQADWWQSTGAGDLWTSFQETRKSNQGKPDTAAALGTMEGCDAEFKAVFANGSLIANAAQKLGLDAVGANYPDLIRGYAGDIFIQSPAGTISAYVVSSVGPCDQNKGIEQIVDGTAQLKLADGTCTAMTDVNRNLRQYVSNQLVSVATKFRDRQPLAAAETALINTLPVAVALTLKTAVAEGMETEVITQLADLAAKAYAFSILTEVYHTARDVAQLAIEVAQKNGTAAAATDDPAKCSIANVQEAISGVDALMDRLDILAHQARSDYAVAVAEINTVNTFVQRQKEFSEIAYHQLQQRFGDGVADRVMGKP